MPENWQPARIPPRFTRPFQRTTNPVARRPRARGIMAPTLGSGNERSVVGTLQETSVAVLVDDIHGGRRAGF